MHSLLPGKFKLALLNFFSFLTLISTSVFAQTLTAQRGANLNSNCNGFYEYLPEGYASGANSFPLLIFIHGQGDLGNGNSQLDRVLNYGIPNLINKGTFPESFRSNGKDFSFVVFTPQFKSWPSAVDMEAVIDYAIQRYDHIDKSRIYLTGTSMGGGASWDYASAKMENAVKLAALVPVCGASTVTDTKATVLANSKLHIWATHNDGDPEVPASRTRNYINSINRYSPAVTPKASFFNNNTHDAWTLSYDPAFREDGMNIYEWMLQFTSNDGIAEGPLPVTLGNYTASLTVNNRVKIDWTTLTESNNAFFIIEKSIDSRNFEHVETVRSKVTSSTTATDYTFEHPSISATTFFRVTQVDIDGKRVQFGILKVSPSENTSEAGLEVVIAPNPVASMLQVNFRTSTNERSSYIIFDASGKTVKTGAIDGTAGLGSISIELQYLNPGMYYFKWIGKETCVLPFLKN